MKADLMDADLSGANLLGADLRFDTLMQANLSKADLREANLTKSDLNGANLTDSNMAKAILMAADLMNADLRNADLTSADLRRAKLTKANLHGANLFKAEISRADMTEANADGANFSQANLKMADLRGAQLVGASLTRAKLREANLCQANLAMADLTQADLIGARAMNTNLQGAVMMYTDLRGANLGSADLTGADLSNALLVNTNLKGAKLNNCRIHGTHFWNMKVDARTEQLDLIITPLGEATITVDSLEIAQFLSVLLGNETVRRALDTIRAKIVLILGHYPPERTLLLNALRNELRARDYLPVLLNLDQPAGREVSGRISILMHLARFVIADFTGVSALHDELQKIVPNLPSVAVQPVLPCSDGPDDSCAANGGFEAFQRFPWFLEAAHYCDMDELVPALAEKVIAPAEAKAEEIRIRRIQ